MTLMAGNVPVEVERAAVRRLNLRIRPDGTAHLSVPARASLVAAQRFLDEHAGWLEARMGRRAEAERQRAAAEASGLVPVWGRLVEMPDGSAGTESVWRAELARALPDAVVRGEERVGAHAAGWQLRDMRTRWGSCTPATGRIRLAVRLAAYPEPCLSYVVAHELTHLVEPSHNARFHQLLTAAFPREAEARTLLARDPYELARARG